MVTLLDAECGCLEGCTGPVWSFWKTLLLDSVLRSMDTEDTPFPDHVFRALMEYRSPMGGRFAFEPRRRGVSEEWYTLVWHVPRPDAGSGLSLGSWSYRSNWFLFGDDFKARGLSRFGRAWTAQTNAWNPLRAGWVAAVVCGVVGK